MTRIAWDGAVHRRMVDAARRGDGRQWVDLAARALTVLPPCRPVPRSPVYHVRVDDVVLEAAEHDLTAALLDLITAVLALGEDRLAGSGAAAGPGPFAQTGRRVNVIGRLRGETGCLPGVLGSAGPGLPPHRLLPRTAAITQPEDRSETVRATA